MHTHFLRVTHMLIGLCTCMCTCNARKGILRMCARNTHTHMEKKRKKKEKTISITGQNTVWRGKFQD